MEISLLMKRKNEKSNKLCKEKNCFKRRENGRTICSMHRCRNKRARRIALGLIPSIKVYYRTLNGYLIRYYTENKKIYNFQFTKEQFMEYSLMSNEFNEAYKLWKNTDFNNIFKPCLRTLKGPQWKLNNIYWDCRGGKVYSKNNKKAIYELLGVK